MKNKWKIGFLLLVGINLLFVIVMFSLVIYPSDGPQTSKLTVPLGEHVSFHVKSNKNDLNKLINHYLEDASDSPVDYRVVLGEEVELYGTLSFFGEDLNMKLTFRPNALENGDLVLKQKSMTIGGLHLPISYVLNFISQNYKIPKGVDIRAEDKLIYINMQQLKLKSDIKIKADKFDLKKDDIAFTILVPVK
jgi:uncharacterized protein YpmS